ncbi:hypothetical protein G6M89_02235 [Natronolimnobius sp. AArcel1]|uniref:hypothetical protein n=1 Tax=Natronolimnobius sp. AArcel1 TaxID=1679093 RepID=UPI0013EB3F3F|nr:hypothetical protein [Natronolimnobius sp. AArcel1]NGM67839.1 hypothetical protein [Natronolimnobius sp. AArcel1]
MPEDIPRPDPLVTLQEQQRDVSTAELWGGKEFEDVFPTFSTEERSAIHDQIQNDVPDGSHRLQADD